VRPLDSGADIGEVQVDHVGGPRGAPDPRGWMTPPARVRERLSASAVPACVGHGDWESQNIFFVVLLAVWPTLADFYKYHP
jgi:hypothetical protein